MHNRPRHRCSRWSDRKVRRTHLSPKSPHLQPAHFRRSADTGLRVGWRRTVSVASVIALVVVGDLIAVPPPIAGAQAGDVTYSTDTALTADVDCANLTIDPGVTLTTDGFNIYCTGTVDNQGTILTGYGPTGTGARDYPNSYGGSGGGGAPTDMGNGYPGWSTIAPGGTAGINYGAPGGEGSTPSPPTMTASVFDQWQTVGMTDYLIGADGGNGQNRECAGYVGSPGAYGIAIEGGTVDAGTIDAAGQAGVYSGCSGSSAGGGGGVILIAYGSGGYTAGSYDVSGGAGSDNSGAGGAGQVLAFQAGQAVAPTGTFTPIWANVAQEPGGCSGPLTTGFSDSGGICGWNASTGVVDYLYVDAGGTISYNFSVPAGASETLTYGIPAGGYLNNAAATVSVDGGSSSTVDTNLGPPKSTASTDLVLWEGTVGPGSHSWTITSEGSSVNVYGLWLSGTAVQATLPGAPIIGTATAGDSRATVTWSPPASDGGSPITGYTVTSSPGGLTAKVGGSATQATVTGLTNGTSYTFTVTATNAVGTGPPSAASNAVTPSPASPSPVTVSPGSINFGSLYAGLRSRQTVVTVTNTGSVGISVGLDEINTESAGPLEFTIVPGTDSCYNTTVAPGADCTVDVAFVPGLKAAPGPVTQVLSFQINVVGTGQNVSQTVALSGTVLAVTQQETWGYCFDLNAAAAFGILSAADLTCLVDDPSSPSSVDILTFGQPSSNSLPSEAAIGGALEQGALCSLYGTSLGQVFSYWTRLLPSLSTCSNILNNLAAAQASAGVYAIALDVPSDEALGSEPYYLSVTAGVSAGIGKVVSAGGQVELLQSPDATTWGFLYGYNVGVAVGSLPIPITPSINTSSLAVNVQTITLGSGEPDPVDLLQEGSSVACLAAAVLPGSALFCSMADAPSVATAGAAWVEAPSGQAGLSNFAFWYEAVSNSTVPVYGTSVTSTGSANATSDGVTAVGQGSGTVVLAQYLSDPEQGTVPFQSSGEYFDLSTLPGSTFSSVKITDCNLSGGTDLEWWNQSANYGLGNWEPVIGDPGPTYSTGPPACLTAVLDAASSPTVAELTGTVLAVASLRGYWLVSADGTVYDLSGATSFGSLMGAGGWRRGPNGWVVGIAATPDGGGYWLVAADGSVSSFGDATKPESTD